MAQLKSSVTSAQSPSDSLRAAKDEVVRQHILRTAEKIFAELGFTPTKMQTIARQAGVSLATLYQFYPGKKDLHREVLLSREREMMAAILANPAIKAGQGLSIVPLLQLLSGQLGYLLANPAFLAMILQEGHAWYHAAAQPTADEQALWKQGLALMSAVFRHGMDSGELLAADPEDQARLLMALQQARLANWLANGANEAHEQVIARVQADFVRQFCRPRLNHELLLPDGSALKPDILKSVLSTTA